jgi:hypothetical protein
MKAIILVLVGAAIFAGCKKSSPDTEPPTITLNWPANNQVFNAGDSVHVNASISDNDQIHEVHLYVTNLATNNLLVHFEEHLDAGSFLLDKGFVAQAGVTYKIEIDANDHSGNQAQKVIQVIGR